MGGHEVRTAQKDRYAAIIDQDDVTEEVRNIALKYDPVDRRLRTASGARH